VVCGHVTEDSQLVLRPASHRVHDVEVFDALFHVHARPNHALEFESFLRGSHALSFSLAASDGVVMM
jgi:hypothetical protein